MAGRRRSWWGAPLAVTAIAVAFWIVARGSGRESEPPPAWRIVEPRLTSESRWAPYRPSATPAERATTARRGIAGASQEAKNRSDVAAARYVAAVERNDVALLASALAAADAALAAEPALPEAAFNRALILERLGIRDDAAIAWRRYLEIDGTSGWSTEARARLRALEVPAAGFRAEFTQRYEELSRDASAAHELARRFPQEARVWGETYVLSLWADAYESGDRDAAARHLSFARELGTQLARDRGDVMLLRAVTSIERAGEEARHLLAAGHRAFREGQSKFKLQRPADAEKLFDRAVEMLERGGSPVALLARYFRANTIYDQGRADEARVQLLALLANAPPELAAYRAQLQWQLGLVHAAAARWGDSIDALKASIAGFERLGELDHATSMHELLAEVYDLIGDGELAWAHRAVALRVAGRTTSQRLLYLVAGIADAALMRRDWPLASSFLALQREIGRRVGDHLILCQGLLSRGYLHHRLGDRAAALRDLDEARREIARVPDSSLRGRLTADTWSLEALLSDSPPSRAANLLSQAIEFHHTDAGRRLFLPGLYLQRGRVAREAGDTAGAARDFEAGIAELEMHRQSLPDSESRAGIFFRDEELFEEAIVLAAERGDAREAFRYAERARARALLDTLGGEARPDAGAAVPADMVVVEYATLPAKLMIFVVDASGLRLTEVEVKREDVQRRRAQLAQAADAEDAPAFVSASTALYRLLIAPIEEELASKKAVAFVPDVALDGVPFAALQDGGGVYVVERQEVTIAPSMAVFQRLRARERTAGESHSLVVRGPSGDEGDLVSAKREAAAVAAIYPGAVRLEDAAATRRAFASVAPAASVIHFAGHAIASEGSTVNASFLLFAPAEGDDGRQDIRTISALRLGRAPTVVLAACSTSRGASRGPEGVLSVSRAFLAAGATSVVGTLWPIDDGEAALFFPRVHQGMARGEAPAAALRAVQLEWIRRPHSTPFLWGAVQVMGRN